MSGLRAAAFYVTLAYSVAGLLSGTAFYHAIPAANLKGALYIGATWPAWVTGSPIHIPCPSWAFSFGQGNNKTRPSQPGQGEG